MPLVNRTVTSTNDPPLPREAQQRSQIQETTLKAKLAVRRVPFEILGEIFLRMPTDLHPRNYQSAVAKVSLVCKRWREAALLTPDLWYDVWVRADGPHPSNEEIFGRLRRGGNLPKSLELSSPSCGGVVEKGRHLSEDQYICAEDACLFLDPIFPKLLKQSQLPWRTVALNCPTPDCLKRLLARLNGFEPNVQPANVAWNSIQALELGAMSWSHWPAEVHGQQDFFSFIPPSVVSLAIRMPGEDLGWTGGDWEFPLRLPVSLVQGLTNLELTFGRLSEIMAPPIFDTLQHCTNLESLAIDFLSAWLTIPEEGSAMGPFLEDGVLLPKLKRIHLSQVNTGGMDAFGFLRMPRLLDMYLSLEMDDAVDVLGQRGPPAFVVLHNNDFLQADLLVNLIRGDQGTRNQFRSLHIKGASFCSGVLFHILRDLTSLEHLTLEWIEFLYPSPDDDDFRRLKDHLPNLQTLEILHLKHAPNFEIPFVQRFLEDRNVKLTLTHMPNYAEAVEQMEKDDEEELKSRFGYDSDSDEKYRNPMGFYGVW